MRHTGLIRQTLLTGTILLLMTFTSHRTAAANDYDIPGAKGRFELWRNIVADKLDRALLPAMPSCWRLS